MEIKLGDFVTLKEAICTRELAGGWVGVSLHSASNLTLWVKPEGIASIRTPPPQIKVHDTVRRTHVADRIKNETWTVVAIVNGLAWLQCSLADILSGQDHNIVVNVDHLVHA